MSTVNNFDFTTTSTSGLDTRVSALENRTVAGVTATAGSPANYAAAQLITALGLGTVRPLYFAMEITDATAVDGSATTVDLVGSDGITSGVPLSTLLTLQADYLALGTPIYFGPNGSDTGKTLYTLHAHLTPWTQLSLMGDDNVYFRNSETIAKGINTSGPNTLTDPTVLATKIDSNDVPFGRTINPPTVAHFTPDSGDPNTLKGITLGIDSSLGGVKAAFDTWGAVFATYGSAIGAAITVADVVTATAPLTTATAALITALDTALTNNT